MEPKVHYTEEVLTKSYLSPFSRHAQIKNGFLLSNFGSTNDLQYAPSSEIKLTSNYNS